MFMAKKRKKSKESPPKEEPEVPEEAPEPQHEEEPKSNKIMRTAAVAVLLVIALFLAYHFLYYQVSAGTFAELFADSEKVFIVMDISDIEDQATKTNVLQCGVDFAGSNGMAGKNVSYFSIENETCYVLAYLDDGIHSKEYCMDALEEGITIYVKEGPGGAEYFRDHMSVYVNSNYTLGTCGIHRK